MEGMFQRVDGGVHLESGKDVKKSLSGIRKFKSPMKGEELSIGSPTTSYGSLSICGRRRMMEDIVSISPRFILSSKEEEDLMVLDFFAVYDGHGGSSGADLCREKLHFLVVEEVKKALQEGDEINWKKVFGSSFGKLDDEVHEDMKSIGCTALVALISLNEIIVANCGESKAVLCRQGDIVPLSLDHKPERPDGLESVEAAAGRVVHWDGYRVLGILAASQSIGDQCITSVPEVSVTDRREDDEFIILASDGLWNVITYEMACYVVSKYLQSSSDRGTRATEAATLLAELAMAKDSMDNISVVVIELNEV